MPTQNEELSLEQRIDQLDPMNEEEVAELERLLSSDDAIPEEQPAATTNTDDKPTDDATADAEQEAAKADSTNKKKAETKPDDTATDDGPGDPSTTPEGIATKDGKHTIPYSVLERERERAAAAEALAARANETAETLAKQLEAIQQGKDPNTDETSPQITEEELAEMEDISPEMAKLGRLINAQRGAIEKVTGQVVDMQSEQEQVKRTEAQLLEDEKQAAIDNIPDLVAWQEEAFRKDDPDPTKWDTAVKFDMILRDDPHWGHQSFDDRFAEAVRLAKVSMGLPLESNQLPSDTKQPTDEEIKRQAEEKLKAKEGSNVPQSLSEIPGDANIAQTNADLLENASTVDIAKMFDGKSPEQIEAELARMGF